MKNPFASPSPILILFVLILPYVFSPNGGFIRFTEAGKGRVHITDDLDDVVDDEEDEDWKEWGKQKTSPLDKFDPPKVDFDKMKIPEIREEMLKHHYGLAVGFVKLQMGTPRSLDTVAGLAKKWSKILKTGGLDVKFMGVDLSTLMFTMQRGQDLVELKEFVLNQPEAYELKIGDQAFRRPGDPPVEAVLERRRREQNKENEASATPKDDGHPKEEL